MASEGTHSQSTKQKKKVYISYDGSEEIHNRLIGNLNHFLSLETIKTNVEHWHRRGADMSPTTVKEIEESSYFIVVFNHTYAFNTRCLDELVEIHECVKRKGQLVRPLYFQVDQSEVQQPEGSYKQAIEEHRENFKHERMKVVRWELALHDVANFSGWTFIPGSEHTFVKKFVEDMGNKSNSSPLCNADCLAGLESCLTEPQTLFGPGSCDDVDTVGKNGIGRIGAKCNTINQNFPNVAQLKPIFISSHCKESDDKEGLILVLPSTSTASISDERGLGPKMSHVVQNNVGLENVQLFEEIGTKERKLILDRSISNVEALAQQKQTWAKRIPPQLLDSRANQVSILGGVEDGLISREVNRNHFDFALNDASMEASFASVTAEDAIVSAVQDAGSLSMRASENTKSAMQTLRTCVSKRFPELILEGPIFKEYFQRNVDSFSEDGRISPEMGLIVKRIFRSFTQWSQDYEDADSKLKTTTADLSKVAELKETLEGVVIELNEAVSDEKEWYCQLASVESTKRELEEQLEAVTAKIRGLSSSFNTAAARKRLLLDNGTKLQTEKDNLMIRLPRIRAEQEAARLTQEIIEDEWLKLAGVFNEIFMLEYGPS